MLTCTGGMLGCISMFTCLEGVSAYACCHAPWHPDMDMHVIMSLARCREPCQHAYACQDTRTRGHLNMKKHAFQDARGACQDAHPSISRGRMREQEAGWVGGKKNPSRPKLKAVGADDGRSRCVRALVSDDAGASCPSSPRNRPCCDGRNTHLLWRRGDLLPFRCGPVRASSVSRSLRFARVS